MSSSRKPISTAAFSWLFDHMDRKRLLQQLAGHASKELRQLYSIVTAGGFKLSEATLDRQRIRLCTALQRSPALLPPFLDIAAQSDGPWKSLQTMMERHPKHLRHLWRTILQHAAQPPMAALALAAFPEDSWQRRLAFRLLKIDSVWKENTPEADNDAAWQTVRDLCTVFGITPPNTTAATTDGDLDEKLAREYRRGRAEERQEQEQKAAAERRTWDARLKEALIAADDAEQERNALKTAIRTAQAQADSNLKAQKSRLENQFQISLDNLFTQAFLTDKPLVQAAAQGQWETSELLAKLADATEQQLAYSRSHGSRTALLQQKQALTDALEKLQHAADDAVVTISGLPALMAAADRRIHDIESQLTQENTPSLAFSQIAAFIDAIKLDGNALRLLEDTRHFARQAWEHEILTRNETEKLLNRIEHRSGILKNSPFSRAIEQNLAEKAEENTRKNIREIWNIMQYAAELPQVTLVIDGYNAMMRNDFWNIMTRDRSFDEARRHFIQRCIVNHDRFQAIVAVFDGAGSLLTHEKPAPNMTVTFAPRINDAHNADDVIVACAQELRATGKADLLWVVTNDYDLRQRLEDTCDAFVETRAIPQFFLL